MKISIYLLVTVIFIGAYGAENVPEKVKDEFHELAASRLDYMLKNVIPTGGYLTMSFIVSDCMISSDPKIETIGKEWILEEETCGTIEMHEWCNEKPGRVGVLMTSTEKGTALTRFVCNTDNSIPQNRNSQQDMINNLTRILFVFVIIAICWSWRLKCTRPVPIHPSNILNLSNKSNRSDEFEVISFDTTKSSHKSLSFNSFRSFFITIPKKFRIIV